MEDPAEKLQRELSPIEQDPRFLQLLKEYKCNTPNLTPSIDKVQSSKGIYMAQLTAILS